MAKMVKLTRQSAIEAMCHRCMGGYPNGPEDCGDRRCPLYAYMPFATKTPIVEWLKYDALRKGHVLVGSKEKTKEELFEDRMKDLEE